MNKKKKKKKENQQLFHPFSIRGESVVEVNLPTGSNDNSSIEPSSNLYENSGFSIVWVPFGVET